ncbi:ATP-binding cassette domain-containing protein [Azospirillum sp. INR13]|uniref:ATP-binding cassette domain-containing protein n=1 Tax=Azospirillum sp. INR13 TaxID=2596919 RepID=UPI002103E1CA|nr:ATP-binding cassette domain-containing protein [Azospirillum sp. INR13]
MSPTRSCGLPDASRKSPSATPTKTCRENRTGPHRACRRLTAAWPRRSTASSPLQDRGDPARLSIREFSPQSALLKSMRREAEEKALDCIARVNLTKFADVHPHMLSGGMKQRVAIARAMAMEPDILLMDEPFAALDALTRRTMQEELLQLWDDLRFTVLFVTHSIEEALVVGSRILVLSRCGRRRRSGRTIR